MPQPRCYFSLRSPYSWLAYRELCSTYAALGDRLEWIPFWEPDEGTSALLAAQGGTFHYSVMSRAKHLYVLQDVGRLARRQGLVPRWPVDRAPVWEVPHLAYLVAARQDRGAQYLTATYRARWEQGRDICDPATVCAIGTEIGLDGDALAAAGADAALRAEGARILRDAGRDGVFGVPFFVSGRHRFWGLDRLAAFADHVGAGEALTPSPPEPPVAVVAVGSGADDGHAGGCG
jgi:2-hydroxychromene-2-carboxylate isomerase